MAPSSCFRVIVSVALITIQCSMYASAKVNNASVPVLTERTENGDGNVGRSPTQEFVATGNIPVWTAYRPDGLKSVTYLPQPDDIIKAALDYRNSTDFKGLSSVGRKTIGDEIKERFSSSSDKISSILRGFFRPGRPTVTEKSATDSPEDRFLSLLIMMDYGGTYPENDTMVEVLVKERILYALAFLSAVQRQISNIGNVRASGLIIGLNKRATPYVDNNRIGNSVRMNEAYASMLKYWAEPNNANRQFPLAGYHVVATMTDSTPGGLSRPHAKSSFGIRCDSSSKDISGLIFYDDLGFNGIPLAVRGIAHILGATIHDGTSKNCPSGAGYVMSRGRQFIGRKWADCSLQEISQHLKNHGSCLKEPRGFRPAGKPIPSILPGQVMTTKQLCVARGWKDGQVCHNLTTCENLYCTNKNLLSVCTDSGHTPDGTWLDSTKKCLDGKKFSIPLQQHA